MKEKLFEFSSLSRNNLLFMAFLAIAIAFQVIPFHNLFYQGIFKWHIMQPNYLKGAIILIQTAGIMLLGVWFLKNEKHRLFLVTFVLLVFLFYYRVLVPALVAIVYFEALISIGNVTNHFLFKSTNNHKENLFINLLIGLIAWTLLALTLSAFNIGSITNLRLMTVALGFPALLFCRKNLATLKLHNILCKLNRTELSLAIMLLSVVLMQFAKSTVGFGHDSLWYGVRPEQVLIPNNSIYEGLGLLQFVYYYPKFIELLFVPITIANEYSFIFAGNTVVFALLIFLIVKLLKTFNISQFYSLLFSLSIVSIPAINNLASSSKTDLFTTFLMLLSIYFLIQYLKEPTELKNLLLSFSAVILSLCGKYTSFMFLPAITTSFLAALWLTRKSIQLSIRRKENTKWLIVLLAAMLVFIGIHFRTYILTGFPTYPLLVDFWKKLGFDGNFPFAMYERFDRRVDSTEGYIFPWKGILEYWFDPKKMAHIVNTWTGNLLPFLLLTGIFFLHKIIPSRKKLHTGLFFLLFISIELFIIRLMYIGGFKSKVPNVYGGDGNYYMLGIIAALVLLFALLYHTSRWIANNKLTILCFVFICFQGFFSYYSHPSWNVGIERMKLKSAFDWKDTHVFMQNRIHKPNNAVELMEYLKLLPPDSRGIFYSDKNGGDPLTNKPFPILVEPASHALMKGLGIKALSTDMDNFKRYLDENSIGCFIYEDSAKSIPIMNILLEELKSDSSNVPQKFNQYSVYIIPKFERKD